MRHIFIFNLAGLAALICPSISPGVVNRQFDVVGTLLSRKTGKPVKEIWVQITGERGEVLYDTMLEMREAKFKTNKKGYFCISVFTRDPTIFQINATTDPTKKEEKKKYSVSNKDGDNFWETDAIITSVGNVYMDDTTLSAIVSKVTKKVIQFKEDFYEELDRKTPR